MRVFLERLLFLAIVTLSLGAISPQCHADLSAVLNDLIDVGTDISAAQKDCRAGNGNACAADIQTIDDAIANVTQDLTKLAHDCFGASGNGTLCARLVERAITDIEQVGEDSAQAIKDCSADPKGDNCALDLQTVSSDAARAVVDLTSAITECATAPNNASQAQVAALMERLAHQKSRAVRRATVSALKRLKR